MEAEANVTAQGLSAYGQTKGAQLNAQGQIKAAKIGAEAQKQSSMMGAIGSIGGALIGLSDETTKTAITPIDTALEKLRKLKPVPLSSLNTRTIPVYITDRRAGLQKVMPDAVYTDEATGKMCIDTGEVIALLCVPTKA